MKMLKTLMVGAVATLSATSAFAAVQGGTGTTSTGSLDVEIDILEEVKISNLDDISLSQFVPDGTDETGTDDFCVYYNNATGILMTVDSNGTPGTFQMENTGNFVPYSVAIDENLSGTYVAHAAGASVVYANMADGTANDDCVTLGAETSSIEVTVTDAGVPFAGIPNGNYTDTIDITVVPNP